MCDQRDMQAVRGAACACDAPEAAGWALQGRQHIKVKMRASVRRVGKEDGGIISLVFHLRHTKPELEVLGLPNMLSS